MRELWWWWSAYVCEYRHKWSVIYRLDLGWFHLTYVWNEWLPYCFHIHMCDSFIAKKILIWSLCSSQLKLMQTLIIIWNSEVRAHIYMKNEELHVVDSMNVCVGISKLRTKVANAKNERKVYVYQVYAVCTVHCRHLISSATSNTKWTKNDVNIEQSHHGQWKKKSQGIT